MNHNVWNDFIGLFFPNTCLTCSKPLVVSEKFICLDCFMSLPVVPRTECGESDLIERFALFPEVIIARSFLVFRSNGPVQQLIHAFKYQGNQQLAVHLGKLIFTENPAFFHERQWDGIIPVPLHRSKFRKRGYNQSEMLAAGFSEVSGIPVLTDQVVRVKKTRSQTGKSRSERWQSMQNIYRLSAHFSGQGQRLILIDDVVTTGATISGLIEALLAGGVSEIGVVCLASED